MQESMGSGTFMNGGESLDAVAGSPARQTPGRTSSVAPAGIRGGVSDSAAPESSTPVRAEPLKRKLKISYDKYMSIQTLVILHLAELERTTGRGSNRDDLIDWYLEQKESEINDVDELEYEKELIGKVLNKLVKVRYRFQWTLFRFD